ncbi:hypothetical protein [Roseomonas sp. HF4]|uniref:hypothetical protein n=1 Tax=Roseomonas sp. HF4 TaxID=2562313 RepID=UPI0010BF686E|nr:hypothetical protein [Roseomonas sp. HF4]
MVPWPVFFGLGGGGVMWARAGGGLVYFGMGSSGCVRCCALRINTPTAAKLRAARYAGRRPVRFMMRPKLAAFPNTVIVEWNPRSICALVVQLARRWRVH